MTRPFERQSRLAAVLLAMLIPIGLLAYLFVAPGPLGLWIVVGATAAIWHRRSRHYWVASLGATVVATATAAGMFVLGVLTFDPFITSWEEAAGLFLHVMLWSQIMGLPIALLVGLLYRRSRRLRAVPA
jgi:hypothetical protein